MCKVFPRGRAAKEWPPPPPPPPPQETQKDWKLVKYKMAAHKEDLVSALESSLQVKLPFKISCCMLLKLRVKATQSFSLLDVCISFPCHR